MLCPVGAISSGPRQCGETGTQLSQVAALQARGMLYTKATAGMVETENAQEGKLSAKVSSRYMEGRESQCGMKWHAGGRGLQKKIQQPWWLP